MKTKRKFVQQKWLRNLFFVNAGPNLGKSVQSNNGNKIWKGEYRVMQSLYLSDISENKIIATVSKFKSKYSCDSDGLDRFFVKKKKKKDYKLH